MNSHDVSNPHQLYTRLIGVALGKITPASSTGRNRCKVVNSVNQSIGTGALTVINFDNEAYDFGALHDTVTNNSRIVVPSGGTTGEWRLVTEIEFAANATGRREVYITKNGITIAQVRVAAFTAGAFGPRVQVIAVDSDPAVGDFYDVRVFQDSGGPLNVVAGSIFAGANQW